MNDEGARLDLSRACMSVKVVIITMMTSLAHGDMASGSGSRVNEEAQLCGLAAGLSCEC